MKIKIALINPWVYDFAAANLWARPLGLLKVAERLSRFAIDLTLIDCMDGGPSPASFPSKYRKETVLKPECLKSIPRKFSRYGISTDDFVSALREAAPFDFVFMTSIMSYWYPGVQTAISLVRKTCGNIPVVLGGIYATLWKEHAVENSGADFIHTGPAGEEISFTFNTFGYRQKKRNPVETPYYRLGLYHNDPFAPLLTGTGCPYRCSYCASHLLSGGFTQRCPDDVLEEVKELYGKGVRDFAFYDDALLVHADSHLKPILKEVAEFAPDTKFHCPNGLHSRFIDDELASLMWRSGFRTLRLGLETTDAVRQKETGGKVCSDDVTKAVKILKRYGFTKDNIGVYLMFGLPGQSIEEVNEGIAYLKQLDVRINLTEFSPIPGTVLWDELVGKGIISKDIDPLLTNNSVFSYLYSGYDPDEIKKLKLDVKEYNISRNV